MKKLIPLILMGLMSVSAAEAGIRLNVEGGVTEASPSITGNTSSAKAAATYGATVDIGMVPMADIEIGVLSSGKKTDYDSATTVSTRGLEIPVLLRFGLSPMFDLGIGGYYEKYNSTYDATDDATGIKSSSNTWTNKTTDFGAKASARLMLPIAPTIHFLIDVNYKYGLTDLSNTPGASYKSRELAALGGLSFGF